ncbi:MAG: zf-HC2 domain-containing protein [Chloroflexota bacterium]
MTDHRRAIELAATAIDFELDDADRRTLDEHVDTCPSCRADMLALRKDAAALADLVTVAPPAWVRQAIGRRRGPRRAVLLVAAALVLVGTVGVALAVGAALIDLPAPTSSPIQLPSARPTNALGSPVPTDVSPTSTHGALPVAQPTTFPVNAGSVSIGPGPDGSTWVLVDQPAVLQGAASTSVIGLLDAAGKAVSGWPISFTGWSCGDAGPPHPLAVASDGSLRLLCVEDTDSEGPRRHVAMAFSADGRSQPGWPVELGDVMDVPPVVVGDELRLLARQIASTDGTSGSVQAAAWWLVSVSAGGIVEVGQRFSVADAAGNFDVRLAADGVAYRVGSAYRAGEVVPAVSSIDAIDLTGERSGWPVSIEGYASHPSIGPDGRLVITRGVGQGRAAATQVMVIDPGGGGATAVSDLFPMALLDDTTGAGGVPLAPIFGGDGAIYVIGSDPTGQRVYVVKPDGQGGGVPSIRLRMPLQTVGSCSSQDTGCGVSRVPPVVGPDGTLYVPESVVGEGGGLSASAGGSLLAISRDGSSLPGWPVDLPDPMAGFWSVLVRADGTVEALAASPTDAGAEWTLMVLGPDGRTRASTVLRLPGG